MKFHYKAKDENGTLSEGVVEATSKQAAAQMLQENKLIPVSLQPESVSDLLETVQHFWEGASTRELSIFFRQFATLIDAKVSIVTALKAIEEQTENQYLRTVILEVVKDLEDGSPLSEAMSRHPRMFSTLMVSMIRAGEASGNLSHSIMFIADNLEKNYELSAKIRGAMFYPGFIASAALIIGFLVFTLVIPKLTKIFEDMKVEVPWYTKIFMNAGAFMQTYWWLVLILAVGVGFGFLYYIKTEDGRREWDLIQLKIPIFGNIFRYVYLSRFAENLSILLVSGIPIVRALMIVSEVVNNSVFEAAILRAADEVKTGGNMSGVFAKNPDVFPAIVSRMIKIGEDSGKISDVLNNVSTFYEKELDRVTRNLTALIEPILIVVLGGFVAVLVFAILMPIYNITGSLGQ